VATSAKEAETPGDEPGVFFCGVASRDGNPPQSHRCAVCGGRRTTMDDPPLPPVVGRLAIGSPFLRGAKRCHRIRIVAADVRRQHFEQQAPRFWRTIVGVVSINDAGRLLPRAQVERR
jgi:hypothetical protein